MTNEAAVGVLLRLAGLCIVVKTLSTTFRFLDTLAHWPAHQLLGFGGIQLFWLLLGAGLLFAPLAIARLLLPAATREQQPTQWDLEDLQRVLFATLGLYFLVIGLSNTTGWLGFMSLSATAQGSDVSFASISWGNFGPMILQIVAGLWLLLGSKGLHEILRRIRTAGTR